MKSKSSNLSAFKKFLKILKENGLREITWWGWEDKKSMLNTEPGNEWGDRCKKEGTVYAIQGYDGGDKFQGQYTSICSFAIEFKKDRIAFISRDIEFEGNTEEIVMESIAEFDDRIVNA